MIVAHFDLESPEDLAEFEDHEIDELIASNKLDSRLQNKRLLKAYREIKYDEDDAYSTQKSRGSTISSRSGSSGLRGSIFSKSGSGSMMAAIYHESKESSTDGSFIVKNYRIFDEQQLIATVEGHCKVVLAETDNLLKTALVAKISTDTATATSLTQEMNVLKHLQKRDEDEMIIHLIDWVEDFDGEGNNIMIMERARSNGDLAQLLKNGHLNSIDDLSCVSIAKNLLQIGQCLQKSGVVWGDVKPANFVSFSRMSGIHFKAVSQFVLCIFNTKFFLFFIFFCPPPPPFPD